MPTSEQRTPTGFAEPVNAQVGTERREFQALAPSPLPPKGIDISPSVFSEFDDNIFALADLARAREASASCNIENISVTDDLAVRSALRTAFGPASGGTSAGGGTGRLMRDTWHIPDARFRLRGLGPFGW